MYKNAIIGGISRYTYKPLEILLKEAFPAPYEALEVP
jgi:hypothetical protein